MILKRGLTRKIIKFKQMKWILIFLLFISFSSIGQSLSPYFTRTRTLQLEGYGGVGVNIPYSYSAGSIHSWTINDTLADQWVNERVQAAISGFSSIDSVRVYDSLAKRWKTEGLTLIQDNAEIRVAATNELIIGKAAGSQLTFNDTYTLLGNSTDITGFFIDEADSSASIISDSTGIRVKQNNVIEIVDERNDVGFRRHGLVGAGDYSDAIRGTPRAYTQMKTVRDYVDSLVATLDLSGDYWPLSGNFSTLTSQFISPPNGEVLGFVSPDGNSAVVVSGTENHVNLTSLGDDFSEFVFKDGNAVYFDGNNVKKGIQYFASGFVTDARSLTDKGYVDANLRGITLPTTSGQALKAIRVNSGGTAWEYYTPSSGGVNEAYVATSIDSVDNATEIGYTPATTGDWPNADPTTVQGGLDSLAKWNAGLRKLIIPLNDWNMQSTSTLDVNITGITSFDQIRSVSIIIRNDNNNTIYPLEKAEAGGVAVAGGWNYVTGTNTIRFERYSGAFFDSVSFDATSFNRGWLTIEYVQ